MANKNNVETNNTNTETKKTKSNKPEQKKSTQKKKLRLHSHLKVNIPLFQSLMMILPSLAKHSAAEGVDNSSDEANRATENSVPEKVVTDDHGKANSSAVTHQDAQTSKGHVSSTLSVSHAANGSNTHLVPSHHLLTVSHPQVHYIPSVSMPTISLGSNGQPTHSSHSTPTTPALPVTFVPEVLKGTYGELHVDANGQYTFVLNPNSPQYILLNQNKHGTDHFVLNLSDGSKIIVQIPVTGKQDTPTISGDLTGVVTEDHKVDSHGLLHVSGKIDVSDPDQNESSVKPEILAGKYGSLSIDAEGHWQYHVDNSLSNIQALTSATSLHESFVIHTQDGTPQTLDMTIGGNDDNAVVTGVDLGAVTEDVTTQVQGQLTVNDSDLGEDHFQSSQINGHFGTLIITKDGTWAYDLDNSNPAVQRLGQGSTVTDIITVHSADGTPHQITVTVNGTNDVPVIAGTSTGQVTEESALQTSGKLTISDTDTAEAHFSDTDIAGSLGTLHLKDNGDWTYDLDNKNPTVQALGQGKTTTERITVHSADGTPHQITITVNGTNDTAVIAGTNTGAVTEETQLQTSGTLTISDTDNGEAHFSDTDINGQLGTLHLKDNGNWTYDLDNKNPTVQALGHGKTATDRITVHSADGTAHQIMVTINGSNNTATIAGVDTGSISENSAGVDMSPDYAQPGIATLGNAILYADGKLTITDPDVGESGFERQGSSGYDYHGTYGDLILLTDGTWHYHTDAGHIAAVGGRPTTRGTAIDQLGEGQSLTDTITVHSKDGTTHDIVITIHGSNDRPYCSSEVVLQSGSEDTRQTLTTAQLLANTVDVDKNDAGLLSIENLHADHGSILNNADGTFTFTPEKDYNGDVHFSYDIKDAHGGISHTGATTSLAAVDDHTVFAGIATATAKEDVDSGVSSYGNFGGHHYSMSQWHQLTITDTDNKVDHVNIEFGGNTYSWQVGTPIDINTQYGKFEFITVASGAHKGELAWLYNGDNTNASIQGLKEGESLSESITLVAPDGTRQSLSVDIKGTEDHVIIDSPAHLGDVIEHLPTGAQVNGQLQAHDIDTHDSVSWAVTQTAGKYGAFSVDAKGQWQYVVDEAKAASLGNGQEWNEHFTVEAISTDGSHVSKSVSVVVHGNNDAATITGVDTGSVTEDHNVHASVQGNYSYKIEAQGTLTATDTDAGESGFDFRTLVTAATHPEWTPYYSKLGGELAIDTHGNWNYYIDNRKPEVQNLGAGETLTDTVTIHSKDGTPHVITITINGTNDAPILGVNQTSSTTGTLTETDVDVKDSHTFSVVSSVGQFGSLSVDPNTGAYIYTPNTSITGMSYNSTTNTYHGVDVFEVKVSDQHTESSKFITFDASGHLTMSPTGGLITSMTVPQQPMVTTTQPTLPTGTNVAPTNAITLDLASTSDTGSSNTDNLTSDTTPTMTGHTDIPYSQVTVYDGSTPVGHAVSDASGQYSVAVSSLSNGEHNLSAKALAPSSVIPATSSLLSVHVDTQIQVGIHTDPITGDNVINAQESNSSIDITGSVSGDYNAGDLVTLDVNGTQHTGTVDAKGYYSIAVPGGELIADTDQKIEASIAIKDNAGNSAHATTDVTYQIDTQVSLPTITFESAGADNLYSKTEIARGHANTITATVTPPGDAKIGEHLVVNGQDYVLDAHSLQHGIQIEVRPGSHVQATMTDEHGNTAGSQGFAASAIPEPIVVRPPSGSHQVSGTLGVPPLLPSLTPVPTAQSGWRIHLPNGQYVTSHHGQYGTLTIDPQTGHLHYQEQAQVHTGPHGSASGIGQHEDKFEVALQGANQDEVVAHVNIQILSHGPGHSGKLTVGTEVVDMTITPLVHTSHPAPPPPPVQHDEPDMASQTDFTVTLSDDSYLDLTQHAHHEPDQKTSHHGAAAYLDALGIKPDATSTAIHDQPADMDIVLAQVDQQDAVTHDQTHLDMSDALEHHDKNINHNQDDEHHHNQINGLPDIDPNS